MTLQLTVSPTAFAQQMHWLAHHGYHPITVAELYAALHGGVPLPARPVVITFDDGYRDVLTQAAPVLARLRFPAIAFVITGRISGSDPSFLTWGELTRLEADGVEIGSHTVTHLDLGVLQAVHHAFAGEQRAATVAVRGDAVVAVWPGYVERAVGVAVDIGSTTIAGHLCDLTTGEVLSSAGRMNPQIRFGDDLMSRVSYVMMNPGGDRQLTESVRTALNELIDELCDEAGEIGRAHV